MERHGLVCSARHRALGDARVLVRFLVQAAPRTAGDGARRRGARRARRAMRLPAHLPAGLGDELPEGPGVYRFFGADDVLLYVGKSHSLRTRVLAHFAAEHAEAKEQTLARQVRRIDWLETAGELGALLREAEWIKSQQPLYNRRLKERPTASRCWPAERAGGVEFAAIDELDAAAARATASACFTRRRMRARRSPTSRARTALCLKVAGARAERGLLLRLPARQVPGRLRRQGAARAASVRGSRWRCRRSS